MATLTRRAFGFGTVALAGALALSSTAKAETLDTLKIGYQKSGLPVIARQKHLIEDALSPQGTKVEWVEFSAGPPLIEALNTGAIHVGWTGDAPPIFGQAAGAAISYVAALPSNGQSEAIIVPGDSPANTIADLRGKRIAAGRGTSAHNLLVAALEKAGIPFTDIEPVYLLPADAAAAFASGQVDAWSIWDPYLAIAEVTRKPKVILRSADVIRKQTFFLANSDFARDHPAVIQVTIAALQTAADWANAHRADVAQVLHEITGVPLAAQRLAADRETLRIVPLDAEIVAIQQATADRFQRLGLIPRAINVADAVWTAPKT